jgi:hypothetical protein
MKGHLFAAVVVAGVAALTAEPSLSETVDGDAGVKHFDRATLTVGGDFIALPLFGGGVKMIQIKPNAAAANSGQLNVDVTPDYVKNLNALHRFCERGLQFPNAILASDQFRDRYGLPFQYSFTGLTVDSCRASSDAVSIQFHYASVAELSTQMSITLLDGTVVKPPVIALRGIDVGSTQPQGPGDFDVDVAATPGGITLKSPICIPGTKPRGIDVSWTTPTQPWNRKQRRWRSQQVQVVLCQQPASLPQATNIQFHYLSATTENSEPPASPTAPDNSRTTNAPALEDKLGFEFGVPLEFSNVETGIASSPSGGSTLPPFSSKIKLNNDHASLKFGFEWWKPIDFASQLGMSFDLRVPLRGTDFRTFIVGGGTCPTCVFPGTQSFAPRLDGSIFVNYGTQVDLGCEHPPLLFLGAGLGVKSYKFGTSIPAFKLDLATEHTDVVPGFQAGVKFPFALQTTWLDLGLTAGYFLPGSSDRAQVGNTVITNKVGGSAFVEASMTWEIREHLGLRP